MRALQLLAVLQPHSALQLLVWQAQRPPVAPPTELIQLGYLLVEMGSHLGILLTRLLPLPRRICQLARARKIWERARRYLLVVLPQCLEHPDG